jgi:hypothetical protein
MNIGLIKKEKIMINLITDREKGTVKWFNHSEIVIHSKDVMYAFEYGNELIMIKTNNRIDGTKFILYNINGAIILSYSLLSGAIFDGSNKKIFESKLISVEFSNTYNKIIVIIGSCLEEYKLVILDINGKEVANIAHPRDYYFYSTKYVGNEIMVVCQGASDQTKDNYGRNDWNFRLDLNNYYVEKMSITQ